MSACPAISLPERLARCLTSNVDPAVAAYVGWYGWQHNPLRVCQLDGRCTSYALVGQEELRFEISGGLPQVLFQDTAPTVCASRA